MQNFALPKLGDRDVADIIGVRPLFTKPSDVGIDET